MTQSFQTNATLIDDAWCDFIRRRNVHIGVSVDGPAFLHDRYRPHAAGRRHIRARAARDAAAARPRHRFNIITVLTADSLAYPDELFDFYVENGVASVAFNVEEIEGPNVASSLARARDARSAFAASFRGFSISSLRRIPRCEVREFDTAQACALASLDPGVRTQESRPFAILNVDCEGNFSTYSPELLGLVESAPWQLRVGQRGAGFP